MVGRPLRAVYCADISVTLLPISRSSKLSRVQRTVEKQPITLDENLNPIFISTIEDVSSVKDIKKYTMTYEIKNIFFLSNVAYKY
tara:strand:- start:932 stop:1186 length:255 start_codon:yes stop_codon:yes gene_type:complete